jgi:hypothetical protein
VQSGGPVEFPNTVELCFLFTPSEPFGVGSGPSKTARLGSVARLSYNAHCARDGVVSNPRLERVLLNYPSDDLSIEFNGNEMRLGTYCQDEIRLGQLINWVESVLVGLLGLEFIDSPIVSEISGRVGDSSFVVIYAERSSAFDVVTVDMQKDRLRKTLRRLEKRDSSRDRRLTAALRYFIIASRLEQVGYTPWEFMSEVILNLAKILEVLFPAAPSKTMDAARTGLARLGYESPEIEKWFIPTLALRSNLDVAHVSLALFDAAQLEGLHTYTQEATRRFQSLLATVVDRYDSGVYVAEPYDASAPTREVERILDRIALNFPSE